MAPPNSSPNPQDTFYAVLRHVLGSALDAAGYVLDDNPMQQGRGLFRFRKPLVEDRYALIDFQMLYYPQSELSRFRVSLTRVNDAERDEQTLSQIIWHDYNARVLPSDDHWWLYKYPADLGQELLEAGKLLFGYGVPWVEDHPQP